MKTKHVILLIIASVIVGFIAGDYMAYHFAKVHGEKKRGGLFQLGNQAGPTK